MKKDFLVSVIIPSFNNGTYIKTAIESVLCQTYKNIEILVIDDGSTDNTEETLKKFLDNNKIIYIKKENGGPASARNMGIELSKGEYVAFLDSDDVWVKTKLEKQIYAIENSDAVIVHTQRFYIHDNVQIEKSENITIGKSLRDLLKNNYIVNSSVLIKKDIIKKYLFDDKPEMFAVEDYALWLNLKSLEYKFAFIDESLTGYRIHQYQISNKALKNIIRLYLNVFIHGLIGKVTLYSRFTALYMYLKLSLYSIKLKLQK